MTKGLFSTAYLAPIEYYALLLKYQQNVVFDLNEHFVKQTYRNRCYILGPNGLHMLRIPLIKVKTRRPTKAVQIANTERWQKIHWKSLEAAYRRSPYFEFYEDQFAPYFLSKKFDHLHDLNDALLHVILPLLNIKIDASFTQQYEENWVDHRDYRNGIQPKTEREKPSFKKYTQVFGDRNDFHPNLSIVDLLFNEGPNATNYLKDLAQTIP